MRRIKETLSGLSNDSNGNPDEQRKITDRVVGFVRDKGGSLVTTVHEHVTSVTDTTGAIAKQKLLQGLFASGVIQSKHIGYGLQIGIGYFLSQQSHLSEYVQRVKFPASGGVTPPHSFPDFDIEAYGLDTFISLMNIYNITPQSLRQHICNGELKEIVNPSSSGASLYLTSDSSYLIKTVRGYDAKFIQQKFLQAYHHYIQQTPGTFITKLFGVYGYIPYISPQRGITVDSFILRFAIFANLIPTNLDIHEKYDLKGSSYKRDANFNERIKNSATFKDNDFRDIHPQGIKIPSKIFYELKNTLLRDVTFLENLNIMDYSLLLIIHNMDNPVKPKRVGSFEALMGSVQDAMLLGMSQQRNEHPTSEQSRDYVRFKKPSDTLGFIYEEIPRFDVDYAREFGGIPAVNEKGERLLLFLGIIDILQTFDICKSMQRQYQTVENPNVVAERSIVDAKFYAQRFKEFIFEGVFHPADDSIATNPTSSSASFYPQMPYSYQ